MKKIFFLTSLVLIFFLSCEPAEDRIVGYYRLDKLYLNDKRVTESEYDALNIGSYYTFFYEGNFTVATRINGIPIQSNGIGTWQFVNKNKQLQIHFVLHNRTYKYTADVIKFSSRSLKYKYTDKNGKQWTLQLYKSS
ncbi:MAG: hypothetical protein LBU51_01215 [Bacteroidales bacterium]|jgi:hypothetical protein|nr:hypothetical protein [Bacteroidales bacterium]